jgi:hypothetical protein
MKKNKKAKSKKIREVRMERGGMEGRLSTTREIDKKIKNITVAFARTSVIRDSLVLNPQGVMNAYKLKKIIEYTSLAAHHLAVLRSYNVVVEMSFSFLEEDL